MLFQKEVFQREKKPTAALINVVRLTSVAAKTISLHHQFKLQRKETLEGALVLSVFTHVLRQTQRGSGHNDTNACNPMQHFCNEYKARFYSEISIRSLLVICLKIWLKVAFFKTRKMSLIHFMNVKVA